MSDLENLQTHMLPVVTPETDDVLRIFRGTLTAQATVGSLPHGGGATGPTGATGGTGATGPSGPTGATGGGGSGLPAIQTTVLSASDLNAITSSGVQVVPTGKTPVFAEAFFEINDGAVEQSGTDFSFFYTDTTGTPIVSSSVLTDLVYSVSEDLYRRIFLTPGGTTYKPGDPIPLTDVGPVVIGPVDNTLSMPGDLVTTDLSPVGALFAPADTFEVSAPGIGGAQNATGVVDIVANSFPITSVNTGAKTFVVTGDLSAATTVTVYRSTGNDSSYSVVSAVFAAGSTTVVVGETVPDTTADGYMGDGSIDAGTIVTYHLTTFGKWFYVGYSADVVASGGSVGSGAQLQVTSVDASSNAATLTVRVLYI